MPGTEISLKLSAVFALVISLVISVVLTVWLMMVLPTPDHKAAEAAGEDAIPDIRQHNNYGQGFTVVDSKEKALDEFISKYPDREIVLIEYARNHADIVILWRVHKE